LTQHFYRRSSFKATVLVRTAFDETLSNHEP